MKTYTFDPDERLPVTWDFSLWTVLATDDMDHAVITIADDPDLSENEEHPTNTGTLSLYPDAGGVLNTDNKKVTVDVYGGEDGDSFIVQCLLFTESGRKIAGNCKVRFRENAS